MYGPPPCCKRKARIAGTVASATRAGRYTSLLVNTAQAMRASLLASATIATFRGVRAESCHALKSGTCFILRCITHHRSGSLHEQHLQVLIAPPRNFPQHLLAAGRVLLRDYPQPYGKVTSPANGCAVADGGDDCELRLPDLFQAW